MKSRMVAKLAAGLLALPGAALSADGFVWSGSVGLGYQGVHTNALDPSNANEYRDLSNGVLGSFDIRGRGDDYYLNFFGENIDRDDQYIDLKGGKYGVFKYQIYNNDLRHNFGSGYGALTPYSGAGSSVLTAASGAAGLVNRNPSGWGTFDNSYKRQDIGGMFEVSLNSPFYVRFDGNQVNRDGIKVIAASQGTSPGNGFVDLPSPVSFTTNNYSFEAGYQSERGHVALTYLRSQFSNDNPYLRWTNGFFNGGSDTTVLSPDSTLSKLSLNGNLRKLPWGSTLAGRVTYGENESSFSVLQTMLATAAGGSQATSPSTPAFSGEVVNKTASLSLTSQPGRGWDTRLYWNWSRKDNNSTQLTFTPIAGSNLQCSGGPCTTELFNYKKNNLGAEAGYRVNPENRIIAGFDYLTSDRERVDFDHSIDRKYSFQWKNSGIEAVDTNVKYQYLQRRSSFVDSGNFDVFVRRFDLTNVNQNLVKVTFDYTPLPMLDFGLETIFKHNQFNDGERLWLGRDKDDRQEVYLSVGYGDPSKFRVLWFGDMEVVQYDSQHRVGGTPASGDPTAGPAPAAPATSTSYDWTASNRDISYQLGVGADWLPREQWRLKGSAIYARSNSKTDFATQSGTILAAPGYLLNQNNIDNSSRVSLNLAGTYSYSKNWDFTGGYAFERYRYSDIAVENNSYVTGAGNTTSYASGLYAYPNYTTNIVYVTGTYKFRK